MLLQLEKRGVLEATRERRPPHYHVALFSNQYAAYVDRITSGSGGTYVVRSGDSLWGIAQDAGVSVASLRRANGMSDNTIFPGQKLTLPHGE